MDDRDDIALPPVSCTIPAEYHQETPAIDGRFEFELDGSWAPVISSNRVGDRRRIAAWFRLGWSPDSLYLAAVLPGAEREGRVWTGETPEAPFFIDLRIDARENPTPEALGNYELRFVPLVEPPDPISFTDLPFLRNRQLGAGSAADDPGIVVWGEQSHAGILPEGVAARWRKVPGVGLTFEALLPWRNLRIKGLPRSRTIYLNFHVRRPGMRRSTFLNRRIFPDLRGGKIDLIAPGTAADHRTAHRVTALPRTICTLWIPPVKMPVFYASGQNTGKGGGRTPVHFELLGPQKTRVADGRGRPTEDGHVAEATLAAGDVPDGMYTLRVRSGPDRGNWTQMPVYFAGEQTATDLRPRRERAQSRITRLHQRISNEHEHWQAGHLARASTCLEKSYIPGGASVGDFNECYRFLRDAESILESVADGERPDFSLESSFHPAGFAADGRRGPVEFVPVPGEHARLTVDAEDETPWQISPLLFGTFSEPLSNGWPIYRNMHAQEILNPSFEWGSRSAEHLVNRVPRGLHKGAGNAILRGEWVPIYDVGDGSRIAAPWLGIGEGPIDLSVEHGGFNTDRCQRVEARQDAGRAGIAQIIKLPVWRCKKYRLRGFLRGKNPPEKLLAILRQREEPVGQSSLENITPEWQCHETVITVRPDSFPHTTFLLELRLDGPGDLEIDQVTLFPEDAVDGMDPDVVRLLKKSRPGWIRWPGGNFASAYHWRDGIGPLDTRPTIQNPAWQGLETNLVGTDEYLDFCKNAEIEPLICVNAGNGTPKEAADWVEYCNGSVNTPMGSLRSANGHPEPYGVRYWNIGNEQWGRWQIGCAESEENAQRYAGFAKAMRERDPSIRLIACGLDQFSYGEKAERWNDALVELNKDDLEMLDFHVYVNLRKIPKISHFDILEQLAAMPAGYEGALMAFRRGCVSRGREDLRVDVGEYNNSHVSGMPGRLTFTGNLLAYAGWLHTFMRQGEFVKGANATEFSSFNPQAIEYGRLHPRIHLFSLYAAQAGKQPVRARIETPVRNSKAHIPGNLAAVYNLPLVDTVALKNPENKSLAISLINRDIHRELTVSVQLNGFRSQPQGRRYLFWDDFPMDDPRGPVAREPKMTNFEAGNNFTVKLPPHSVTLLKLFHDD